jgi:hypothetical protein
MTKPPPFLDGPKAISLILFGLFVIYLMVRIAG